MDRGHLSPVLPRSWRRLARRRSRGAGSGEAGTGTKRAADIKADGAASRALAALSRRRCASVVGLLSRAEKARGCARELSTGRNLHRSRTFTNTLGGEARL